MAQASSLYILIAIFSFMISHATILPRQDALSVGATLSTSTSSFNWWPYPAGGVTTSTSPIATLALVTPTLSPSSSSKSTSVISSSTSMTQTPTHGSAPTAMHITTPASSPIASSLAASHSSDPKSLLKAGTTTLSPLWLVPVCLLLGAIIGCALGWLAWRRFGDKRDRHDAGLVLDGYAWPYKPDADHDHEDGKDEDVENGRGHEYFSLKREPHLPVGQGTQRVPSTASTSGARTWVGHPQPRKRSGAVGPSRTNTLVSKEAENNTGAESPLLTQLGVRADPKAHPASPLPSSYSYGDDEDIEDEPYNTVRHKSVRRRIWERLGFAESDLGRKKSKTHQEEGRHTWSAGVMQERGADVSRTLSFWGRRKTMKEGRVERWVRSVRGEAEGDTRPRAAHQEEAPRESTDGVETQPRPGTPELVLNTLRGVSPKTWHPRRVEHDPTMTPDFVEVFSPTSHQSNPTLDARSTVGITPSDQRRSVRHVEHRRRGVSLQDPGPTTTSSGSASQSTIKRTTSISRNAFPLPSTTSSRSKPSQRSTSSPAPPSPSSVSRYSATPHMPAHTTLHRSPTRTPSRRTASRDIRPALARAMPSSRLARPVSNMTPPSTGLTRPLSITTPPTTTTRDTKNSSGTRFSPSHGVDAIPQRRPIPDLPPGPSSIMSPPLQSALSFDDTMPLSGVSWAPASSIVGTRLSTSSHAARYSSKGVSASGSKPPHVRATARATTPRSRRQNTEESPVAVPAGRPFSAKERYLARRNANARVEMILTRSYSSRNFDERPVSPTMFGAVIDEEVEGRCLEDGQSETLTFLNEDGEGIEQRLDRLRMHGI